MAIPTDGSGVPTKVMRLRYAGTCRTCGVTLRAGVSATYDRSSKTVTCVSCPRQDAASEQAAAAHHAPEPEPEPALETGAAGASARREYERRSAKRETRIREAHPHLGGLILALSDEPQSTTAWARGAKGEEMLGQGLDRLRDRGVQTLHDRRIPRTKANIDHLAIGPGGVVVIDAKRYKGRPHLVVTGGIFRPRRSVFFVGSRDCTKLVEGVHKQVTLVRGALESAGLSDVPVRGMLCFVDADWPLFGGSFVIDGVDVLWPRKAADQLLAPGPIDQPIVDTVHRTLALAFPVA